MHTEPLPVAVIGAGPVGLAAAAHLHDRGLPFLVLEAGDSAAAAVRDWGHVRLFSPWRYCTDPVAARLLTEQGWTAPDGDAHPTGAELADDYLAPLAAHPAIAAQLRLQHRVTAVTRAGVDRLVSDGRTDRPFEVVAETPDGEVRLVARAVIDASGTWRTPAPAGTSGVPARGERDLGDRLTQRIPDVLGSDRADHAGRTTLVVGAGHSAINAVLDLGRLAEEAPGTRVVWAVRRPTTAGLFGGEGADELFERGALGTRARQLVESGAVEMATDVRTTGFRQLDGGQVVLEGVGADGGHREVGPVDRVVALTGFRPDHAITSELRLDLDPIVGATADLAPLIDPNLHSCGTVPPHGIDELSHPDEPGYVAVGMKSYGRAPTFLMMTGFEQVRSVVADLAGDHEAARQVELDLPETGVCTTDAAYADSATVGGTDDGAGDACCDTSSPAVVEPLGLPVAVGAGLPLVGARDAGTSPTTTDACCS